MHMRLSATIAVLAVAGASACFAQGTTASGDGSGSSQAYRGAMMKMHQDMDVPLSGNPDRDFVTGMIPHHQGAIDMARVELRYGKDPQLRRLAEGVVAAQEKEIGEMRAWLAKHPR